MFERWPLRERRMNQNKRQLFEEQRMDLMRRLDRVCGYMARAELKELASSMTRIRLKYDPFTGLPEIV